MSRGETGRALDGLKSAPQILLLVEVAALLIGLALPLTPSKTGSKTDFAEYFLTDPTYAQKAFVAFVATNVLIAVLAVVAYSCRRLTGGRTNSDDASGPK